MLGSGKEIFKISEIFEPNLRLYNAFLHQITTLNSSILNMFALTPYGPYRAADSKCDESTSKDNLPRAI